MAILLLSVGASASGFAQTARSQRLGDDVESAYLIALQRVLPNHGYRSGPPTGTLDPATDQAIKAYQADAGLKQDSQGAAALKATLDHITYAYPQVFAGQPREEGPAVNPQPAPPEAASADDSQAGVEAPIIDEISIRHVQDGLRGKGYDLATTGTLDIYTENAIKAFQAQNNLPHDGKIDGYLLDLLKR